MNRDTDVKRTPKADGAKALAKASELAESARSEVAQGRWNSAGLAAIHSGICSADAALIASAGIRSTSADHGAVTALLDAQVPEFRAAQRRQLGGLLKMKNKVAYEQRLLTETEARQLADHADRLVKWARTVVSEHLT